MLIATSAIKLIHTLLSSKKISTLRELAADSGIALAKCSYYVNALERLGYVRKRRGVKLINNELVYVLAYCYPLRALKPIDFESLERATYLIKRISQMAKTHKLDYAFTGLAGAELVSPLLIPNELHIYIEKTQLGAWENLLKQNQIYPSEKGTIHLLVSELNPFYGLQAIRGVNVVSNPLLFADLFSLGGRAREAAKFLAKEVGLNV